MSNYLSVAGFGEEIGRIETAKNTGENYRIGAAKNRSQVYNPKTDWDGRFTDANQAFCRRLRWEECNHNAFPVC